jgi:hypothetical protein
MNNRNDLCACGSNNSIQKHLDVASAYSPLSINPELGGGGRQWLTTLRCVGLEILTVAIFRIPIFWDIWPSNLVKVNHTLEEQITSISRVKK